MYKLTNMYKCENELNINIMSTFQAHEFTTVKLTCLHNTSNTDMTLKPIFIRNHTTSVRLHTHEVHKINVYNQNNS